MLHHVYGRKLGRTANERKRLFRNLTRSLVLHGQIVTTLAKAKAIVPLVEKLVTKAKENNIQNRRYILKKIADNEVTDKLLKEIGPLFKLRPGGYTRIIKTKSRIGDNTSCAVLSFTQTVTNSMVSKKVEAVKAKIKKEDKPQTKKETHAKT